MNIIPTGISSEPTAIVFDKIVEIEIAHTAHSLQIEDVYPWSALRPVIYDRILVATGIIERFSDLEKSGLRHLPALGANLTYRNPFLASFRARNLIVPWTRTQNVHGRNVDVLSDRLRSYLPPLEVMQLDLNRKLSTLDWSAFSMDALSLFSKVSERVMPVALSPESAARIDALDKALYDAFGVQFHLKNWFQSFVAYFRSRRRVTAHLLRRAGIENVFLVVSYGHPSLIAAARDVGARVIELQHGLISRYHIGYDFPGNTVPAYTPDVILTFGEFWNHSARFPEGTERITFGAPHIRNHLDNIDHRLRRRPELLFISQPGIGPQLLQFALRVAADERAPKVIYRLHPREDENQVRKLVRDANITPEHLEVSAGGGGERTLTLQASVLAQVGVYSTAVVEGRACGCRTFLIPLPGAGALASLATEGYASVATSPADIIAQFAAINASATDLPPMQVDEFFAAERHDAVQRAMQRDIKAAL